jgi:hypothetical protein
VTFRRLQEDFLASKPDVCERKVEIVQRIIETRCVRAGRTSGQVLGYNDQADCDDDFLEWMPDELEEVDEDFARMKERTIEADREFRRPTSPLPLRQRSPSPNPTPTPTPTTPTLSPTASVLSEVPETQFHTDK